LTGGAPLLLSRSAALLLSPNRGDDSHPLLTGDRGGPLFS
jgi:hypothetical protein